MENTTIESPNNNGERVCNQDELGNISPLPQRHANATNELISELKEEIRLLKQDIIEIKSNRGHK